MKRQSPSTVGSSSAASPIFRAKEFSTSASGLVQSARAAQLRPQPRGSCSPSAAEAQRDQLERPQLEVDRRTVAGGTLWQRPLQEIRRVYRSNLRGGGDRGPRPAAQRLVEPGPSQAGGRARVTTAPAGRCEWRIRTRPCSRPPCEATGQGLNDDSSVAARSRSVGIFVARGGSCLSLVHQRSE